MTLKIHLKHNQKLSIFLYHKINKLYKQLYNLFYSINFLKFFFIFLNLFFNIFFHLFNSFFIFILFFSLIIPNAITPANILATKEAASASLH